MPNGGKIEYSLGLATAGFLGPLGSATAGLKTMFAAVGGLGGAMAAVFGQISKGGALTDLSARTGESVKDLVQLQHAFSQSGVEASNVAPLLQRYRQALSGIGEGGEDTADAFKALGTSIDELKDMDAPQALQKLFAGLNGLDRNTAAGVAGKIFGRGSAGDILQLARDSNAFADALQRAAPYADQMARNAAAFDRLGDTFGDIKLQLDSVAATIAEKVTPALNLLSTQLRDKDFAGIGQVFELSMKAAIQEVTFSLADAADGWGDIVRKSLNVASDEATSAGFWEKAGKGTLGVAAGLAGLWGQLGGAVGIPGAQAQGDLRMEQAEKLFQAIGLGGGVLGAVADEMAKNPGSRTNVFREQLRKMIEANDDLGAGGNAPHSGIAQVANLLKGSGKVNGLVFGPEQFQIDTNALQRAGLWNNSGSGDMRALRMGVTTMVSHLAAIRESLRNPPKMDLYNR